MKPAEADFFYEATLRICGSLDLETMLSDCYTFIRKTIPADGLAMNIYDLKAKVLEDFSVTAEPELDAGKLSLQLTPEVIVYLKKLERENPLHSNFIVNRPQKNPLGKLAWEAAGKTTISSMLSFLKVGGERIGMVVLMAKGFDRYSESDL